MKILYFSWLREKIGIDSEEIKVSEKISDVNELVEYLKKSSENKFIHYFYLAFLIDHHFI